MLKITKFHVNKKAYFENSPLFSGVTGPRQNLYTNFIDNALGKYCSIAKNQHNDNTCDFYDCFCINFIKKQSIEYE